MLHSKIYFFEIDGTATVFVGSQNLTGFALRGLNGEAGVLLDGGSSDPVFGVVRGHIAESFRQAIPYDPSLKAAYAQWLRDHLDQLGIDATDMPATTKAGALSFCLPKHRGQNAVAGRLHLFRTRYADHRSQRH
jgi:hypothetical protein